MIWITLLLAVAVTIHLHGLWRQGQQDQLEEERSRRQVRKELQQIELHRPDHVCR
mgnify:CR=1 FL=1